MATGTCTLCQLRKGCRDELSASHARKREEAATSCLPLAFASRPLMALSRECQLIPPQSQPGFTEAVATDYTRSQNDRNTNDGSSQIRRRYQRCHAAAKQTRTMDNRWWCCRHLKIRNATPNTGDASHHMLNIISWPC